MKCRWGRLFSILIFFGVVMMFSGCTVSFTQNDTLHLGISEPTEKVMSIVAEFEASETDSVAGDVTQKSGSVCAGGACIIY